MTSRACSDPARMPVSALVLMLALCLASAGPAAAQGNRPTNQAATNQAAKGRGPIANTPDQTIKGAAMAVEGDLLTVNGTAVRLMGIDAPDPGQKCKNRYGHELDCFKVATAVLANMVKGEEVTCVVTEQDRTGERKGECRVRGVDLGAAMVARGWAFQYASLSPAYQKGEAYAQSKRMGLWAGQVEKPWQWRSRQIRETAR